MLRKVLGWWAVLFIISSFLWHLSDDFSWVTKSPLRCWLPLSYNKSIFDT